VDEDYLKIKIKIIASFLPPLPENARLHPHPNPRRAFILSEILNGSE